MKRFHDCTGRISSKAGRKKLQLIIEESKRKIIGTRIGLSCRATLIAPKVGGYAKIRCAKGGT